jgi:hypothetical protein
VAGGWYVGLVFTVVLVIVLIYLVGQAAGVGR